MTPSSGAAGAAALAAVEVFLRRFVAFPNEHAVVAITLWIGHTHASERWYVTPRLVLDSAEPGSGKTRVLELLALLCRAPKLTISTTTAALYRRIAAAEVPITVLMDEVDALFGPRPSPQAEDLRALLNAGYKKGATVDRCVGEGKSLKVAEFPVFAPVALAGLAGRMPATITTRSVVVHMRRRAPGEHVDPFRERDAAWDAELIRQRLAEWIDSVADTLELARPAMPDGVVDRPAEVWEALLAVADAAGGDWPNRARAACQYFVLNADPADASFGVRLLGHIRDLFTAAQTDRMPSAALVEALVKLDESPYADQWENLWISGSSQRNSAAMRSRPPRSRCPTAAPRAATAPTDRRGWPTPGAATCRIPVQRPQPPQPGRPARLRTNGWLHSRVQPPD